MFGLGIGEIIVIGMGLMLLFGARKLPTIARGLGEGIRNFKGEIGGRKTSDDQDPPAIGDGGRKPRSDE